MARRFYAPLLVSGVEDLSKGTVEVHVTSDAMEACDGEVRWRLTDVDGEMLESGSDSVTISPRGNRLVRTLDLRRQVESHGPRNLLLWLGLVVGGQEVSSNLVLFVRPKHLELRDPGLGATVRQGLPGEFVVTITARKPALWAWIKLPDAEASYSDNFVHLLPGVPAEIHLATQTSMTVAQVQQRLRLSSLVNTYEDPSAG